MTIRIKNLIIFASLIIAVFTAAHFAVALETGLDQVGNTGLANTDIRVVIANIIRIIISFLGIISVILIIYAGFVWMTAAGNEERVERAKKILINALIGLVLIIFSFAIATFILNSLTSVTGDNGDGSVCNPACGDGQQCCSGVCVSNSTSCSGVVPPNPADSFRVTSTIPGEGATNVIRNVIIRYNFNHSVNGATVNANTFKVEGITNNVITTISGNRNVVGSRVEFVPDTGTCPANACSADRCLPANKTIKVTAPAGGIISVGGLNLTCQPDFFDSDSKCITTFTTNDAVDCAKPTLNILDNGQVCLDSDNLLGFTSADDSGVSSVEFNDNNGGGAFLSGPAPIRINCPGHSCTTFNAIDAVTWRPVGPQYSPSTNYIITAKAEDFDSNTISDSVTYNLKPKHCCNGVRDSSETGVDCGGECLACNGAQCDIGDSDPRTCITPDNSKCASGFCDNVSCLCQSLPVITGIFPVGNFCDGFPNTACLKNSDCTSGAKTCNQNIPNGAAGNFVTIVGKNFGTSQGSGSVTFNSINAPLAASPGCVNSWSDTQIIVVVPANGSGLVKVTTGAGLSDDNLANPVLPNFLVNTITRPGICSLSPTQGVIDTEVTYKGIKLNDSKAYFGNIQQYVQAKGSPFTSEIEGSAQVSNIQIGRTTSFVMEGNTYSNYLNFTKTAEPYTGPVISSFDPVRGATSTYVTISGRGFGTARGNSKVYFGNSTTGKEASYDFPAVCANSIWSDKQVIVKVPAVNPPLVAGDYIITMKIAKGNNQYWEIDTNGLSIKNFTVNSDPLKPGLCRIEPTVGRVSSQVSLWGEYFGVRDVANSKVRFQVDKNQSGANIGFWGPDTSYPTKRPDKATTTVPVGAVTGAVRVVKGVPPGLPGNGLNFKVGVCSTNAECGSGNLCCSVGTPYAGECKAFKKDNNGNVTDSTEQKLCFPEIKSCVYEWNFNTTGIPVVGQPCDSDISTPQCNKDDTMCGNTGLVCDSTSCTCKQPCNNNLTGACSPNNNKCLTTPTTPVCDTTTCLCKPRDPVPGDSCNSNPPGDPQCSPNNSCGSTLVCNSSSCVCEPIESCSGYGNQCKDSYFCPNSPGQCSTNPGGTVDTGVKCGDSACGRSISPVCESDGYLCRYANSLDRCVLLDSDKHQDIYCGFPKTVPYTLGPANFTGTASCLPYNNQNRWIMTVTTSCPDGWTNIGGNRCAQDSPRFCSICSAGFKCLQETVNAMSGAGVCAVDKAICPAGSTCSGASRGNKCIKDKDDSASCDCCCRKTGTNVNQDCCVPLKCEGECGSDIGKHNPITFGQCTGCANAGTTQKQHNDACNCTGTAGKFCDTSAAGGQGVCKDCAQITTAQNCSGLGVGVCCVDAKNNSACRKNTVYDNSKNPIYATDAANPTFNYCAYYNCDTGNNANKCLSTPKKDGSYRTTDCNNKCAFPPQFGQACNSYATTPPSCNISICQNFSCLNENGNGPTSPSTCGTCCCDPNAVTDQCTSINSKLSCIKDKGSCSGANRGLCCGCSNDSECGDANATGCGTDTCCQARPTVASVLPVDEKQNVCRNTLIQATFSQPMQTNSFTGNVIVAGDYGASPCPADTQYLTAVYKPTVLARVKSWLATWPLINKLFTADAQAIAGNFCAVTGSVSGHGTVLEFKLQKLLEPNRKYYVIIKGDPDVTDAMKNGVLSENGIGMKGTSADFNGVTFTGKIWSFTTMSEQAPNNGVCTIDHAEIEPVSYLFQTNKDNTGDNDATKNTFDKIADSDLVYRARAVAADGSILNPLTGVYSWSWGWNSGSTNVFNFKTPSGGSLADNENLLRAEPTVTEGKSVINATATMGAGGAGSYSATATAYLMVCANPWPAVDRVTGWAPWSDSNQCTVLGTGCSDTGFELYYCRDAGGAGTADDLPAILKDTVTRPQSLKCTVPGGSCPAGSFGLTCGGTGTCEIDLLKELFFFREGLPNVASNILATTTNAEISKGGKAGLTWSYTIPVGKTLDKYKIYYGTTSGNYPNSIATTTIGTSGKPQIISGLTNGRKYYFAFTAVYDTGAESVYSNEVSAIPADTTKPAVPNILRALPTASTTATVVWEANSDDTVSYKLYYGDTTSYGGTVNLSKNKCSSSMCTATITNLNWGKTYHLAVVALDAAGNISATSTDRTLSMVPLTSSALDQQY